MSSPTSVWATVAEQYGAYWGAYPPSWVTTSRPSQHSAATVIIASVIARYPASVTDIRASGSITLAS